MTDFQEIKLFPSDDKLSNVPETPARFSPNRLDPPSHHISPVDRPGSRSHRSTSQLNTPRSRRPISPPPSRSSRGSADLRRDASHPSSSSSSSSSSAATPSIPPVEKWSVNALRQALSNAGIHFSRRNTKVQLHDLLVRSHQNSPHPPSNTQVTTQKAARSIRFASNPPHFQPASAAAAAGATSSSATHSSRFIAAARNSSASSPTVTVTFPPPTGESSSVHTSNISLPPVFQADPSVRLPPQTVLPPPPIPFASAIGADPSVRLPPQTVLPPPPIPFSSAIGADPSVRLPPQTVLPPPPIPFSSAIGADPSVRLPPQTVLPPLPFLSHLLSEQTQA
ncbi:hypothetical protein ABG768_023450 [Culter alburnus]|uniref:Uncharacterized protein n=1 Tax=Culter alburnus TaxID=194366 RepID=A0AAW2APR2_CULAL